MAVSVPGRTMWQIDGPGDALAGYPLQSLLELGGGNGAAENHSQRLVMLTLQNWISALNQELMTFPPADTEVLVQIKQRVKCSRDALQRVACSLQEGLRPDGVNLH